MTKTRTLTVSDLLATLPKRARILGFKNLSNSFLVYFKYVSHICSVYHLNQARRLAMQCLPFESGEKARHICCGHFLCLWLSI